MNSSSAMKKRSCSCSVRLLICLFVGVAVCGLLTISGWPSALYSGYSEESAQTQLQDEVEKFVEPKAHSHKHYHRHSGTPTQAVRPVSTLSSESIEQPVVSDLQRGDGAPSASQTEKEDESQEITDPKVRIGASCCRYKNVLFWLIRIQRKTIVDWLILFLLFGMPGLNQPFYRIDFVY